MLALLSDKLKRLAVFGENTLLIFSCNAPSLPIGILTMWHVFFKKALNRSRMLNPYP